MTVKQKDQKYIEGIGRRKTSVARVRIYPGSKEGKFLVNEADLKDYFRLDRHINRVLKPFEITGTKVKVSVLVKGGGVSSQADAIKLGLARALDKFNPEFHSKLKAYKLLTRDAREVERKKPGLRKARRPQQWRKR